eukprot:118761-Prymnesium_polylepis.1
MAAAAEAAEAEAEEAPPMEVEPQARRGRARGAARRRPRAGKWRKWWGGGSAAAPCTGCAGRVLVTSSRRGSRRS